MSKKQKGLSRRERQIMDIVFRLGRAAVSDVLESLPDPPSYSSIRRLMGILEEKGHLTHEEDGQRYVYLPTESLTTARVSALEHVMETFFGGSPQQTVAALLDVSRGQLTESDLDRLSALVDEARKEGK